MKKYVVTGPLVHFGAGSKLALTPEQASARAHKLTFVKGNIFETLHPVEFKLGEEIGFDGPVPKELSAVLSEEGAVEAKTAKATVEARQNKGPDEAEVKAAETRAAIETQLESKKAKKAKKNASEAA